VPPVDPYPEELHREKVCGVMWCHLGSPEEARRDIAEAVEEFGTPAFSHMGPMPYPALQGAFDGLYPRGLQWYWKGHYVEELPEPAPEIIQEYGERLPTLHSTMHLYPVDGAPREVAPDAMAYRQRRARWSQVFAGVDPDAGNADAIREWARGHWAALTPHVGDTGYINFLMADDEDVVRETWGENYERLKEVKATYDPGNLFKVNHNIPVGS
jgi:FAD/FMN-containing dehydrogenase